jgi:hypothetical protein
MWALVCDVTQIMAKSQHTGLLRYSTLSGNLSAFSAILSTKQRFRTNLQPNLWQALLKKFLSTALLLQILFWLFAV